MPQPLTQIPIAKQVSQSEQYLTYSPGSPDCQLLASVWYPLPHTFRTEVRGSIAYRSLLLRGAIEAFKKNSIRMRPLADSTVSLC